MEGYHQSPIEAKNVAQKMVRYRKSFRSFAAEQLKIAGEPLHFWPCQVPLIESIEQQMADKGYARCVWLKARQVGASTLAQAFVAWRTMLWPNVNAIVIADQSERSRTLFDICKGFYEQMDDDVRPAGRYVTKRELVFANPSIATSTRDPGLRSRITIDSAHKKNIALGSNYTVGHLSEAARFKDPAFVLDGVIPAVHMVPGTILIIESSAERAGVWFRDFCEASERSETAFEFRFVPWFLQPEYQLKLKPGEQLDLSADERHLMTEYGLKSEHVKWARAKLSEMGNDWNLFRQNFPLEPADAWVQAGIQAFPLKALREIRHQIQPAIRFADVIPGPRLIDLPQGKLWIWEEPQVGKAYDIGVDTASGGGSEDTSFLDGQEMADVDATAAVILERGSNKQVAEWVSKTADPVEFAKTLFWLGMYYNTAQIAIETNGVGGVTNSELAKIGYSNIYIWRYRDEIVPRYSRKTGWETNRRSKPWLVGFAIHELCSGRVVIRSERLLKEMEGYVQRGAQEWEAAAGYHDDILTAWMISLLTSDDENFSRFYGLQDEMRKHSTPGSFGTEKKQRPEPYEADTTFLKEASERMDQPWE